MAKLNPRQDPEEFPSDISGNGSRSPSQEEGQGTKRRNNRTGATGPRTELGKRRSSQNAVKFGILSRAILLKGESRADYKSLLEGLRESLNPEGEFEEFQVEKLATISWRYRRLLIAEGAEIRKNSEFLEFDQGQEEQSDAEMISHKGDEEMKTTPPMPNGLIRDIKNPGVLERCLELFFEMRQGIETNGLDEATDLGILRTIYGYRHYLRRTLCDEYPNYFDTAKVPERVRQSKGYATPEQCKQRVVQEIDAEIARLKQYQQRRGSIESNRRKVEILRQSVPDSRGLDRLLRYQITLERDYDRTLTQLERAQRIRKGQPLPPQLDVKIS